MVEYFIGATDSTELLEAVPALLPLSAPLYSTNFSNSGSSTTLVSSVDVLPTVVPNVLAFVDSNEVVATFDATLGGISLGRVSAIDDPLLEAAPALVGTFSLLTSIQGAVYSVPLLFGALPTAIIPIPSPDFIGEQAGGRRPALPWQVASTTVAHINDLTEDGGTTFKFDDLEPFVVSDAFANDPSDALTRAGGLAGYVGIVVDTPQGKALRFRPPYANEVIVRTTDSAVFRWDAEMGKWREYSTLPQRAFDGQQAFQMLDPDGIYDYYAKILGLMQAQHQYDTRRLLDLVDPVSCPDAFLSLLLHNFGADDFDFELEPEEKREILRTFIGLMQTKGTPGSIRNALRLLGYEGYGTHVWVIPQGQPEDIIEKPFGYDQADPQDGATEHFPSSQVNIHLLNRDGGPVQGVDDAIRQRVAEFLRRNVLPAHVIIKWFATDHPAGEDSVGVGDALTITSA